MSARIRRRPQGDSLELLLDTICNTFGGVLFIALLVVILLELSHEPQPSAAGLVSPATIEELLRLHERLLADVARQEENQAAAARVTAALAPDALKELLQQRADRQEELLKQRQIVQTLLSDSAELARQIQADKHQLQNLDDQLEKARATLTALSNERDNKLAEHRSEVRLPLLRPVHGRVEVGVILRYGRAYLWHRYSPAGFQTGPNLDDFVVVSSDSSTITVHPNPLRGIPLDAATSESELRSMLKPFNPSRHVVAVVVRPDTYHLFPKLRDIIVEQGFNYRLMPMTEDGEIRDRGGSSTGVQ